MQVELEEPNRLRVRLEYGGGAPLTVYRAALPWATVQSMILSAVKLDALGTIVEQRFDIDDPGIERLSLTQGQVLDGIVDLDERFPHLASERRHRDIMVFWTYQLDASDGRGLPRLSGSVFLPRTDGGGGSS